MNKHAHARRGFAASPHVFLMLVVKYCHFPQDESLRLGSVCMTSGLRSRAPQWMAQRLDGHEFEQAPGAGDGQGGLACWKRVRQQLTTVQPLSHVRLFVTPWTAARQAALSIASSRSLLKLMSVESVMTSDHLTTLLLPSIFPSIRVFPMSQFFTSGGQSIGVSASASVPPMNIQD